MKNNKIMISIVIILIILAVSILILILNLKNNTDMYNTKIEEDVPSDQQGQMNYDEVVLKENSKIKIKTISDIVSTQTKNYFFVSEVYVVVDSMGTVYFSKGKQQNEDKYYIVYLDGYNHTYKIEETDFLAYDNVLKGIVDEKYKKEMSVEDIGDNNFITVVMTDTDIANMYFNIIKNLLESEPEVLYDILDIEYKQKKFENLEDFIIYVNNNEDRFSAMQIDKYANYKYDDYLQYVCLDTNGNYYIINEDIETGEYSIFLDTYTIDQPEFIEKYEKATDEQKAGYNINKFIQAINEKDYNYAYNCLAESFKQNNFNTLNDFENYMKNNFTNKIELEYLKTYKEGQYFVYETNIINKNNLSIIDKKNFIVNLKEKREFEIYFNV